MKKGEVLEGTVKKVAFPNIGEIETQEGTVFVKNVLPGQKVSLRVNKKKHGKAYGQLLEVMSPSPSQITPVCPHFDQISGCGGCIYQNLPYEGQLSIKEGQVRELLEKVYISSDPDWSFDKTFEGIVQSPVQEAFRNKMEFSFGDLYKDGPLALGMHKRGGFYDIISATQCRIVDADFRAVLSCVLDFAAKRELSFFHRQSHIGYLRHLLVRKGTHTGELLIALVTSSQWGVGCDQEAGGKGPSETEGEMLAALRMELCKLEEDSVLEGRIAGILHIVNDSVADVVRCDRMEILHGKDFFYDQLLGLSFRVTPFSFFQTNTKGAEELYKVVRKYCMEALSDPAGHGQDKKPVIFDLYSGTGTIAQVLAPVAEKVVGVEIVEEAVLAAGENAELNGLHNCKFRAGDVLKVLDELSEQPDLIILDPPRDGIHPKALPKILAYGVDHIIYISCKPTSLARDLVIMQEAGYEAKRICCVDMFPFSGNVETVVLLNNKFAKAKDFVQIGIDAEDYYRIKDAKSNE